MARRVTITISYDMDDDEKPLQEELIDWIIGGVDVRDFGFAADEIVHRSDEAICDGGDCVIKIS